MLSSSAPYPNTIRPLATPVETAAPSVILQKRGISCQAGFHNALVFFITSRHTHTNQTTHTYTQKRYTPTFETAHAYNQKESKSTHAFGKQHMLTFETVQAHTGYIACTYIKRRIRPLLRQRAHTHVTAHDHTYDSFRTHMSTHIQEGAHTYMKEHTHTCRSTRIHEREHTYIKEHTHMKQHTHERT